MSTDIRPSYSPTRASYSYDPLQVRQYSPVHRVVHERSHSPVRTEIHTAPAVVEKVFEKSVVIGAVATDEQRNHCHQLQVEAQEMRARMNDYSNLVDNLRALQSDFNLLTEENHLRKSEFGTRGDATGSLVSSVKQELEDQRGLLQKTRDQNMTLHEELDMQEDYLHNRNVEISKTKSEIDASASLKLTLTNQSNSQIDQLNQLTESNAKLVVQISEQNHLNDQRQMECHDLSVQVNSLEAHQQSLVHRNEDLNSCLQHKTSETHEHQTLLSNHEAEINTLNGQILSFNTQLKHLRSLEEKYVNDNQGLQNKNMDEGHRNCQYSSQIHDLTVQIQTAESRLCAMRGELDATKVANACSIDGNSNLQGQITSLNNHIRVVTGQNAALTGELSSFVQANEALRVQLDRKARVHEIRAQNEEKIMMSTNTVHRSRSPIRGHTQVVVHEPVMGVQRVPVFEDRVVETRVPVMDRVERTIEHHPVGHRVHVDTRSRSPLLHRTNYGVGGIYEQQRMSAATPTIHNTKTIDETK